MSCIPCWIQVNWRADGILYLPSEARENEASDMIEEWRGEWALITGASAGIGVALAKEFAAGGANLVLTARRLERLEELGRDLTAKHKIKASIVAADLTDVTAPEKIYAFTRAQGIDIQLLVNNAGFGAY